MSGLSAAGPRTETQPASKQVHLEQLCRILADQVETCQQLVACAEEQLQALRRGKGSEFVRSSLTQAHLARRLFFLEEERTSAVQGLASTLLEGTAQDDLAALLDRLPEADSQRLAERSRDLQRTAQRASEVQRVNAQLVQSNIQLAAALTRSMVDPSAHYHANASDPEPLPASQLDQRI